MPTGRSRSYHRRPAGAAVIFTETNPAAAKWVLAQAGLIGLGYVRPPLVPLTEPGQAKVRELLRQGLPVLDGPVGRFAPG